MSIQEILKLSVAEKILLVEKIWDSIAEDSTKQPMPEWKKQMLEERLEEHRKNPESGISWEELKKKYYQA
jgi:putative addiction module component (TIGR02574 family)